MSLVTDGPLPQSAATQTELGDNKAPVDAAHLEIDSCLRRLNDIHRIADDVQTHIQMLGLVVKETTEDKRASIQIDFKTLEYVDSLQKHIKVLERQMEEDRYESTQRCYADVNAQGKALTICHKCTCGRTPCKKFSVAWATISALRVEIGMHPLRGCTGPCKMCECGQTPCRARSSQVDLHGHNHNDQDGD